MMVTGMGGRAEEAQAPSAKKMDPQLHTCGEEHQQPLVLSGQGAASLSPDEPLSLALFHEDRLLLLDLCLLLGNLDVVGSKLKRKLLPQVGHLLHIHILACQEAAVAKKSLASWAGTYKGVC